MLKIYKTDIFEDWFCLLRDKMAQKRIQARIDRAVEGNFGDYKSVGENVFEMRIHYGAGYRVYFVQQGSQVVVLLAGGDKSTQQNDIQTALKLAREL
jgi:putative addiction module killer protein